MTVKPVSSIEFVHGDLYGIALEVAKKFVCKSDTRPILTYVSHAANGDLIATDSHRMIRIRGIHGFKEDYLVNPKSFMFAKGNFPETEKLSGIENHQATIVLTKEHIKLWLQLFKSINQTMTVLKDRNKTVRLCFAEGKEEAVNVELGDHGIKMSMPCIATYPGFDVVSFNVEYIRDALEAHFKLNSEQLTFYFHGNMRPIVLDDDANVRTLILPVRTY
jgi:DNA polymerase III sliding clamp (beta) subunit (PCNA family)